MTRHRKPRCATHPDRIARHVVRVAGESVGYCETCYHRLVVTIAEHRGPVAVSLLVRKGEVGP